ncbi:MAG TPA: winged helix-turn-helix domain-containing protein [Lacipirellulaceae bacterium]|nr:winged helix-turn-helix domain-containing protein [Lacipirellulaceae bacterium]
MAGDVWHALSTGGGQSVAQLKKSVGAPDELVLAALGWLAREDKLAFDVSGRSVMVSLT